MRRQGSHRGVGALRTQSLLHGLRQSGLRQPGSKLPGLFQARSAGAPYFLLRGTPSSRRPSVSRNMTPLVHAAAASATYLLPLLEHHGRLITAPARATIRVENNVGDNSDVCATILSASSGSTSRLRCRHRHRAVVLVILLPCWCDAVVVRGPNAHNVSIPRLPIISYATGIRLDESLIWVDRRRVGRIPADRIQRSKLLSSTRYIFKKRETETGMDTLTHRHRSLTRPSCVPLTCSPSLDACIDWARGSSSTLISFEV